jgi:ribosomal protein S24E
MNLKLIKEKDFPLLSRKRYTYEMENDGPTPSTIVLKEAVAKQLKAKSECVAIRHIYTKFGDAKIKIIAHVYDKPENLQKIEDKATIKKNTPPKVEEAPKEEATPATEAKPEEAKEEAPAEEAPKEEEKKE